MVEMPTKTSDVETFIRRYKIWKRFGTETIRRLCISQNGKFLVKYHAFVKRADKKKHLNPFQKLCIVFNIFTIAFKNETVCFMGTISINTYYSLQTSATDIHFPIDDRNERA